MKKVHNLGEILAELMQQCQVSATDLASQAEMPHSTIQQILCGSTTNPRVDTCIKLAQFFNVSIPALIGLEPLPSNKSESINKNTLIVPIISWDNIISHLSKLNEDRRFTGGYILTENDISPQSFGLRIMNESLFCFQKEGIIIIDPQETTLSNGDFILISNNRQKPFLRCVHQEGEFNYLISPIQGMSATNLVPPTYSLGKVVRYVKKFV